MSTSIDERVVKMTFDNAQFESGVQTSLSTLDRLKQALRLDGLGKGLDEISNKANGIKLDGLSSAVDTVSSKFNALEVMGVGALLNIGKQAEETAVKFAKSLSIDNIAAGWDKFEKKTQSVSTLLSQGFGIDEVTEQMDRLNWFTDETSYNFTDMVDNIGKFTASGEGLKESVDAMMGIANWAAMSGQGPKKASQAMMQLSQAMSKQILKYDDWKSIQNAGMDNKQFREAAIKNAIAIGKVTKASDDLYRVVGKKGEFTLAQMFSSDAMSKTAWFSKDVMMKTFNEYSSAVDTIYQYIEEQEANHRYITANQAIEELGDKVSKFGKDAFEAAQKARTWTDVVDSVKDAVSTGWMNTFEIIIGDAEEATALFTDMANELWEIFASGGEERNLWLKYWSGEGGREALLKGFSNLYYDLKMIFEPIKLGFREAFGLGEDANDSVNVIGPKLVELSEKFRDFTRSIAGDGSHYQKIKDAARGIFTGLRTIGEGFLSVLKIFSPVLKPLRSLANLLLDLAAAFGGWTERMATAIRESSVIQRIITSIHGAVDGFCSTLAFLIDNLDITFAIVKALFGSALASAAPLIDKIKTSLSNLLKPVKDFINTKFGDAFEKLWSSIKKLDFREVGKSFAEIFDRFKNSSKVQAALTKVGDGFNKITKPVQDFIKLKFGDSFSQLGEAIGKLDFGAALNSLGEIFDKIKNSKTVTTAIGNISSGFEKLKTAFTNAFGTINSFFTDFFGNLKESLKISGVGEAFKSLGLALLQFDFAKVKQSLKDVFDGLITAGDLEAKATTLSGKLMSKLSNVLRFIRDFISSVKSSFKDGGITGAIETIIEKISSSLENLKTAFTDFIESVIPGFTQGLETIKSFFSNDLDKEITRSSDAVTRFNASLVETTDDKGNFFAKLDEIKKKLETIPIPFESIGKAITNFVSKLTPGKLVALGFSFGILKLVSTVTKAIKAFTGLATPITDLLGSLKGLAGAGSSSLGSITEMIGSFLGTIKKKPNKTLLELAVVIGVLAGSLYLLSKVPVEQLKEVAQILGQLVVVAGAIAVVASIVTKFTGAAGSVGFKNVALIFLSLAGSAAILTVALLKLQELTLSWDLAKKIGVLVGVMLLFGVVEGLVSNFNGGSVTGAAFVLAFAYSIKLVIDAIKEMSEVDLDALLVASKEMIKIIAVLALLAAGAGKIGLFSALGLIGLVWALKKVLPDLEELAKGDYANIKKAIMNNLTIVKMMATLCAGMIVLMQFTGNGVKNFGKGMRSLAVSIGLMALVVHLVGKMDPGVVQKGTNFLTKCFVMFAVMELIATKFSSKGTAIKRFGGAILAMSFACLLLTGVVGILSLMSPSDLKKAEIALAGIVIMLGGFVLASAYAAKLAGENKGIKSIVPMIVGVVALAAELIILSNIPWEDLKHAVIALGGVVLSLAIALASISGVADSNALGTALGLAAVVVVLGGATAALWFLAQQPWENMIAGAASLAILMIGLSTALAILTVVGAAAMPALIGAGVLGLFIFGIMTVLEVLSTVSVDMINQGAEVLNAIGGSFGSAIGNFIGGIGKGISDQLPAIAQNLARFANLSTGFFDLCADGRMTAAASGALALSEVFSNLAKGNLYNNISKVIGGTGTNMGAFGAQLKAFGEALAEYVKTTDGISAESLEGSTTAGKVLVDLASILPRTNGVIDAILGRKDWSSFAKGLVQYGSALAGYANQVKDIDADTIKGSAEAGYALADLATIIPNTKGLISFFTGDNDIGTFGASLRRFGVAINGFAESTKDISVGNVNGVIGATSSLMNVFGKIKELGLGERGLLGGNIFGDFGANLNSFAWEISNFANSMAGIKTENMQATIDGFKNFITTASTISTMDTSSMASFTTSMKNMSTQGVNGFINSFTGASESVSSACSVFINFFISSLTTGLTSFDTVGHTAVTTFETGVSTETSTSIPTTANSIISSLVEGINTNMSQMEQCGRDAVQGFINGVNLDTVRQIGNSLGVEFLAGVSESTGWSSPWSTMIECGQDATNGLLEGTNNGAPNEAGYIMGEAFIDGFREATGWYCTPHEIENFSEDANGGLKTESEKNAGKAKEAGSITGNAYVDGMISGLDKLTGGAVSASLNNLQSNFGDAAGLAKETSKDLYNYITGNEEEVANASETVDAAASKVEEAGKTVEQAGSKVANAGKAVKNATAAVQEATGANEKYFDIMSFGGDVVQAVYERFGAAYEGIAETSAIEASKSAVEALAIATYEASKKAETAKESSKKSAKESKNEIEEIKKSFLSLKQTISDKVSGQMDIFKEFSRETKTSAADMLKNMQSQVKGVADWSNAIQELVARGIDQGLLKKLAEMGPQGYDYVNAFVQMTGEQLQQANSLYATSLAIPNQVSTDILASYAYAGSVASGGFMQGMQEHSAEVGAQASEVANSVKAAFDAGVASFTESGALADQNVGQGVTDNEVVVETATDAMLTQVGEAAKTAAETIGYNAGLNVGAGMAQGIQESVGSTIAEAQAAMASLNTQGVEAPQEINSPSKVWAEYGRYLDLGMAQGLAEYANVVADAGAGVSDSTILAMQNAISQIPFDGLNDDMQPVITPVLDLTNVQNGVSLIPGMIGSQTYGINATANIDQMGAMNQNMAMITDAINALAANQNTGTNIGDINVVVNAEGISDPNELANVVAERIYSEILSREAILF